MTGCWWIRSTDPWATWKLSAMLAGISQRRREIHGARRGLSRSRRHSAVARYGGRRRAGSLHQHRGGGPPGGELRALPHGGNPLGLFSAAQHEQSRTAGYAGAANSNTIVALQVETASCIENIDEIAAVPGVDILFLGQNDLCMSMGLYEKYEFPHMYTSPELQARPRTSCAPRPSGTT